MYSCYYPSNRSVKALIINTIKALKIIPKEKPDLIITSGAAPAIPFFYVGKLFGAKTIYIEVFDRIDAPTIAGRLCYPVTDKFIVEWEEMLKDLGIMFGKYIYIPRPDYLNIEYDKDAKRDNKSWIEDY